MTGYALLNDFYGNPAYILQVEQGRSLFRNSQLVLLVFVHRHGHGSAAV